MYDKPLRALAAGSLALAAATSLSGFEFIEPIPLGAPNKTIHRRGRHKPNARRQKGRKVCPPRGSK